MKQKIASRISSFLYRYLGIICLLLIILDFVSTIRSSLIIMQSSVDDNILPVKSEIENTISNTLMLGEAIVNDPFFKDTTKSLHERAFRLRPLSDAYNLFLIGITDIDGNILSGYGDTIGTIGYREYFKRVVATGETVITDVINAGADGITKNFTICMPYFDEAGKVNGTVILAIYFDDINRIINRKALDSGSHFVLIDSKNDINANPNDKYVNMPITSAKKLSSKIIIGDTFENIMTSMNNGGTGSYWSINTEAIEYVKYVPIENTKWKLLLRANLAGNFATLFNAFLFKSLIYILIFGFLSLRKNKEIFYREKLFNIVAEHIDDVFFIYNWNTHSIDYVSTNVERIFGLPHEKVMADPDSLYSLLDKETFEILKSDLVIGSLGQVYNYDCIVKDHITGSNDSYLLRVYLVGDDSGTKRNITLISNTTKVRQQQQTLVDALKMAENASKSKSAFLSSMSHEIRTPMNAIINMTAFAKEGIDDKEMVLNCIKTVESSANYLLVLINDILDMARIESGQLTITNSVFSLKELISEISGIITPKVKEKRIAFDIDDKVADYKISGDRLKLSKILINILSNAVKFTKVNGHIWFKIEEARLENRHIIINFKISDNGIGMDAEFLKIIFEPFTQGKSEDSAKNIGTGLGMAICKNLVTAMHGTVSVRSSKGKGSEFSVDLPFEIVDSDNGSEIINAISSMANDFSGKRMLVVEDNEVNMQIALIILQRANFILEKAENGKVALDMYMSNPPFYYSGILMDIQMPIMDGLEATQEIRKSGKEDCTSIPIIALSANAFQEDITKSISNGMNEHLIKPLNTDKLFATLRKYIVR